MKITAKNVLLFCLMGLSLSLMSCSGSKNLRKDPSVDITLLKDALKFKTHFGHENSLNIQATNSHNKSLDISELTFIIDQVNASNYKAYTLEELGVANNIAPGAMVTFDLSLAEKIKNDFAGTEGKYNVMIAYDSQKAIENSDDRSIYFVTYKYPR